MSWFFRGLRVGSLLAASLLGVDRSGVALATTAADLCGDAGPCVVSAKVDITDGSSIDLGSRALVVADGGRLDVGSGTMSVTAGDVAIQEGGELSAEGASVHGGQINLSGGSVTIAGTIVADGSDGGNVSLTAAKALIITGSISADGTDDFGFGGEITLSGGTVALAGNLSVTAGVNALAGCVSVNAGGDVSLSGSMRVTGGDGGDLIAVAGSAQGGNLLVLPRTTLVVDATDRDGGSAGTITLTARGDGQGTGHVNVDGSAKATALGGPSGGDGGCIDLTADGDLTIGADSGGLDATGGRPDGFGGEISLVAQRHISVGNRLAALGNGSGGVGGSISINAGLDLTVGLDASLSVIGADDGGSIDLSVDVGELSVLSTEVDASGGLAGNGGTITVRGNGSATEVMIAGSLFADGGGGAFGTSPGRGGEVDVSAARVTVQEPSTAPGGRIQALGGNGGGNGGVLSLMSNAGELSFNGMAAAVGQGPNSVGGTITLSSAGQLSVDGTVDASGLQRGGHVGIQALGQTTLGAMVDTAGKSADALGGKVDVSVAADVDVTGILRADGGTMPGGGAGQVSVRGCNVTIELRATLRAMGIGASNVVIGRELIKIAGNLLADDTSGQNELRYRDPTMPPLILAGATIVPSATQTVDATLSKCPVCGDGDIEPPETCDDGNREDGDGCSAICQLEPVGFCDVNGDGHTDATDLTDLVHELFDGDGDHVADVSGGTFPGTSAADANGDDLVTAADLTRCVVALLP